MPTLGEIFALRAGELISAWAFFSGAKINGAVFLYLPALLCEGYWNFHHRVRLTSQGYLKHICFYFSDTGRRLAEPSLLLGSRLHNSTIHQAEPSARLPAWLKIELFRALRVSPSLTALRSRLIIQTDDSPRACEYIYCRLRRSDGEAGGGKGGAGDRSHREDQRGQRFFFVSAQISTAELLDRSFNIASSCVRAHPTAQPVPAASLTKLLHFLSRPPARPVAAHRSPSSSLPALTQFMRPTAERGDHDVALFFFHITVYVIVATNA